MWPVAHPLGARPRQHICPAPQLDAGQHRPVRCHSLVHRQLTGGAPNTPSPVLSRSSPTPSSLPHPTPAPSQCRAHTQRTLRRSKQLAPQAAAEGNSSSNSTGGSGTAFGDPNTLVGMLMAYAVQLQQEQQQSAANPHAGAEVHVEGITFHPPGSETPLLDNVSMVLPPNSLGLVIGRSGSGKTTLLQVLAGLTEQSAGHIRIVKLGAGAVSGSGSSSNGNGVGGYSGGNGNGNGLYPVAAAAAAAGPAAGSTGSGGLSVEDRMQQVGLVFQFPERHFLGSDLMQELSFTWPRLPQYWGERQLLSARMQQVLEAVGLQQIPLHVPPWALSGGQQRRLALAIQLVRGPALLLLDEPLAGLDWVARQEVVAILKKLKEQCTVLVVSHDLAEIAPLVDCAWRMRLGGTCEPVAWPPPDLAGLEQ